MANSFRDGQILARVSLFLHGGGEYFSLLRDFLKSIPTKPFGVSFGFRRLWLSKVGTVESCDYRELWLSSWGVAAVEETSLRSTRCV